MDSYVDSIEEDDFQFNLIPAVKQILNLMATGQMPVTHSFYLKLYHILVMRGNEVPPAVDRLLVDEAQTYLQCLWILLNEFQLLKSFSWRPKPTNFQFYETC